MGALSPAQCRCYVSVSEATYGVLFWHPFSFQSVRHPNKSMTSELMSQLLAEERRRLLEASSRPSPLHMQNPNWVAPLAASADTGSHDAFATDPLSATVTEATNNTSQGPATLFSVQQLARFSPTAKEELLMEDIRGTLAQFRSPAFPMANAILKTLHTSVEVPSSSPDASDEALSSQRLQSDDEGQLQCGSPAHLAKAMVVDIHDAALCGTLSQTGSGGLVLRQSAQVRVTRATIESLGVAFGNIIAYPHSEVVRVKLIPSCGGIDVLARCFDSEPLQNGEMVMLTVEPGCIRVHCARPKKAQGHWQLTPGDKTADVPVSEEPTAEAGEQKPAGGKIRRKRRGAGKDQPIVDELSLVPLTTEEKLAMLEKKKAAKRQREEEEAGPGEVAGEAVPHVPKVVVVVSGSGQDNEEDGGEPVVDTSASRSKVVKQETQQKPTAAPAAPQPTFVIPGKKGKGIGKKGSKTVLNDSDDD